ncbi:hypothetical protein TNCV_203851 [Trichonephila clavipes]|nr:hypothetical protein TNCV_203851 [Trichonephila clavipes]
MIEEIALADPGVRSNQSSILNTEANNNSLRSRIHHFCTVERSCGSDRIHKLVQHVGKWRVSTWRVTFNIGIAEIISIVMLVAVVVLIALVIILGIFVTRDFSTLITIGTIIAFIIIYGIVCHVVQCTRLCSEEYQAIGGLVEQ